MADDVESMLGVESASDTVPATVAETSIWSFSGRIGRASFWARMVSIWVGGLVCGLLIGAMARDAAPLAIVLYLAFLIVSVWIGMATQVKRWHDLDYSGWMVLINFTLIAIPVVLIIHGCVAGTAGPNKYGPDPVAPAAGLDLAPPPSQP